MKVKEIMKDMTLWYDAQTHLLMKLEGVHDGGMPKPAHVVPSCDVALGRLIACGLHEKVGVRVLLGRTMDLDADVRRVVVEEKPACNREDYVQTAGY